MTTALPSPVHQADAQRFELHLDGHTAHLSYGLRPGVLVAEHTIVPDALGGRGVGSALARHVLDHVVAQGLKLDPQCSFIKAWIDRHPPYHRHSLAHGV
jgi:predicted GNAT family acetyltransferase